MRPLKYLKHFGDSPDHTSNAKSLSQTVLIACFYAILGASNAAGAECAPVLAAPAIATSISATLDSIREKYKLNAIILSVEQNGTPIYRNAIGISTDGVGATTQHALSHRGVGWQLLSTVLMRMVEQDPARLALTDRVAKVVSGLPSMPIARRCVCWRHRAPDWLLHRARDFHSGRNSKSAPIMDLGRSYRAQVPPPPKAAISGTGKGLEVFSHKLRRSGAPLGEGQRQGLRRPS